MRVVSFVWRLPIRIVKSGLSLLNLEPTAVPGPTPRRRPLHTCGAACLAIAHKACTKVQDFDGPLGSIAKQGITFFNSFFPFVYTVLYQWLALLSFMDDQILNFETIAETIFPPSKALFYKIDELVCSAEVLPEHLDDFLRKIPSLMHQFPLLDWLVIHLISWLNFRLSILTHWGSKNPKEKEITVVNCNNQSSGSNAANSEVIEKQPAKGLHSLKNRLKALDIEPRGNVPAEYSPMYSCYQSANSSPASDCSPDGTTNSASYKEILENGKKDDGEKNGVDVIYEEGAEIAQGSGKCSKEE